MASRQKRKVVTAIVDGRNWDADSDGRLYARIGAGWAEAYRGTEGKSCKNHRQMEFAVKPIEGGADIVLLSDAVMMFSLAQTGATEVETEHGEPERVQGLHGVEDNFVVQGSADERMGVTDEGRVGRVIRAHVEQGLQPAGWAFEE
jgi:hypothetical protein